MVCLKQSYIQYRHDTFTGFSFFIAVVPVRHQAAMLLLLLGIVVSIGYTLIEANGCWHTVQP